MALRSYLTIYGISHLTSPPHTPKHNGVSERKHRHIVETGLTLLSVVSMPKTYWTHTFAMTVYLINRLPTPVLNLQLPYQRLFGIASNYEKFRVFGSICFPWLRPYASHKLDDRSLPCVFLGYSTTQSAYHCLRVPSERIYTSRHVTFDESTFPFSMGCHSSSVQPDTIHTLISSTVTQLPVTQFTETPPAPPPCSVPHLQPRMPPPQPPSELRPSQVSSSNLSRPSSSTSSEPTAPNQNGLPP